MKPITTIQGAWSDEANAWVSEIIELTGDAWLEVTLPHKGRIVIKKSETPDGPWPKALISNWTGPQFRIRILHGTYVGNLDDGVGNLSRYVQVITSETPVLIQIASI